MSDMICALLFFGFLAFLIYATVLRRRPNVIPQESRRERGPSPVGLYCEICGEHAGIVSTEEYKHLASPVYCNSCKMVIERYEMRRC